MRKNSIPGKSSAFQRIPIFMESSFQRLYYILLHPQTYLPSLQTVERERGGGEFDMIEKEVKM